MKVCWRFVVMVFFLAGFLLTGLMGTSTSMTFIWPAYAFLGAAGLLSIGLLFKEVGFEHPRWSTLAVFSLTAYLLIRASESRVSYFAREDAALIITAFLCYCLFLSLVSAGDWRRRLLYTIAALVVVNLLFALVQAVFDPTLWLIPGYERTYTDRVGGLFNHPDHFAGFIGALVPVWLGMALYGRQSVRVRRLWGALAALSFVATLAAGSTTGFLALICGLGTFAALTGTIIYRKINARAKRTALIILAASILVLSIVGFAISGPFGQQIDRSLLTKGEGVSLPLIWKAGLKQAAEAPVLGTGSRTSYIYSRLYREEALGSSPAEPEFIHNEFLQMLADYGIVGLTLLLAVLVLHGYAGFSFVRSYAGFGTARNRILPQSDHLALVLGAMSSLAAMGALSLFDFTMHLPVYVVVGAVFLAVLAAPDPMATALKAPVVAPVIPGGSLLFVNRAVTFGCGIAMVIFGLVFSRSEFHYEMARLAFESDAGGYKHFRHLKAAREIDSKNPFIFALSAHARVSGITSEMASPERRQALEQADHYFSKARALYPQDVFAAVGHAAVLDELGKRGRALQRLQDARKMAPYYGNLILAEAEHHLRHGEVLAAEKSYAEALDARAFRDTGAAQEGLRILTEWKLIAGENGIDWRKDSLEAEEMLADTPDYRTLPTAKVSERDLAGKVPPEKAKPEPRKTAEPTNE